MINKKIKSFTDTEVWKKAYQLTLRIYKVTVEFPKEKIYGIISQLRRASVSIGVNIAEGFYRNSTKELINFLYIARGSLYETMTLLEIFRRKRWITDDQYSQLELSGKEIASMIKGLINSVHLKP